MELRYKSKIQLNGKVIIPPEIRALDQFDLAPGAVLKKSWEPYKIILFIPASEANSADTLTLDEACAVKLSAPDLQHLSARELEPLYITAREDLIILEKARCEQCAATGGLLEYAPCHFMCIPCIAGTIHREKERRR